MNNDFRIYAQVSTWKAEGANPLRIGGVVSTDAVDRQSERILQDGLDFSEFMTHGWFNDNHKQGTGDVVGYPTSVQRVKPGDQLPNGELSTVNGWWADGYLLDTENGRKIHDLARSLENTPRRLGFSIEGKVIQKNGSTIKSAAIRNVAVTHCPVNTESSLYALAKALTAGAAVSAPNAPVAGDGFALRTEHMDGEDEETDVAATPAVAKAQLGRVPSMTSAQLVEEWADSLARNSREAGPPELTKSEQDIVAAARDRRLARST